MHPVSLFCWGYRLGMKILCKRNVPYVPGCMLFGQSRTKPAESILVICQELFEEDFDMFFRKKGNFNRPSVYFTYNRMSVRLNIIFGVQLFAGVQLVFDQQSKNESY